MKLFAFKMTGPDEPRVMLKRMSTKHLELKPEYTFDDLRVTAEEVTEEEGEALKASTRGFGNHYAWLIDSIIEEAQVWPPVE